MSRYYPYSGKKTRWASCINDFTGSETAAASSEFCIPTDLALNPIQAATSVSQEYTIKNVEVQFEVESSDGENIENVKLFVMFVPQGMTVDKDYFKFHPEYILAYKYYGSCTGALNSGTRNPLSVKSRLARKLNTGDKIVLILQGNNTKNAQVALTLSGIVKWNAKAN